MRQLENLDPDIAAAVQRLTNRMAATGKVWRFAEIRRRRKPSVFKKAALLTVGECEQLVEFHTRRAKRAIMRYEGHQSRSSIRTAAEHIVRARLYRDRYHHLLGKPVNEADMPFPVLSDQEAADLAKDSED